MPEARDGVILAQGGGQRGYALYLVAGKPTFGVREEGNLHTITAPDTPQGAFSLEAQLQKDGTMALAINNIVVARGKAPGLIKVQPKDELSIGEDTGAAVGDYTAPNPLKGKVENVEVKTP